MLPTPRAPQLPRLLHLPSLYPLPPAIGPTPPEGGGRGALLAWDIVNQKERWRAPVGGGIGGGTVSTAGNLVFQVVPDGRLMAYSADKGDSFSKYRPTSVEAWPRRSRTCSTATVCRVHGRSRRALLRTSSRSPSSCWQRCFARSPGGRTRACWSATGASSRCPSPRIRRRRSSATPKLLVFVLDGNAPLPAAPAPPAQPAK